MALGSSRVSDPLGTPRGRPSHRTPILLSPSLSRSLLQLTVLSQGDVFSLPYQANSATGLKFTSVKSKEYGGADE